MEAPSCWVTLVYVKLTKLSSTSLFSQSFLSLGEPNILSTEYNVYFVVLIFVFSVFL